MYLYLDAAANVPVLHKHWFPKHPMGYNHVVLFITPAPAFHKSLLLLDIRKGEMTCGFRGKYIVCNVQNVCVDLSVVLSGLCETELNGIFLPSGEDSPPHGLKSGPPHSSQRDHLQVTDCL